MRLLQRLTPDLMVTRLDQVSLDDLARRGIKAVLLDLDNTLCVHRAPEPEPRCRDWVEQAKQRFHVCIVSNSIRPHRVHRVAANLGIPAVRRWWKGRKPGAEAFEAALAQVGAEASETAMIGDQLMSDVLGGNRMGMYTVWVRPLDSHEFWGTKPARLLERLLLRRFRRLGLVPPDWD